MATLVKDNKTSAFIETGCIFEHDGKSFESGGSWLCVNKKTGKMEGILYACYSKKDLPFGEVTSWDGKLRIKAQFGRIFNSNFWNCHRQYCWFKYQGKNFVGINYSVDNQDIVHVKEIKGDR